MGVSTTTEKAEIEHCDTGERYDAEEICAHRRHIDGTSPAAASRQRNDGIQHQIDEYAGEVDTHGDARQPVEGADRTFVVTVVEDVELGHCNRLASTIGTAMKSSRLNG
jgi:hypothetical protein